MSKSKDLNNLSIEELKELIIQRETEIIQKDKKLEELKSKNIQLDADVKEILVVQKEMTDRLTNMEEQVTKVNSRYLNIQGQLAIFQNNYLGIQTILNSMIVQEGVVLTSGEVFSHMDYDTANNNAGC